MTTKPMNKVAKGEDKQEGKEEELEEVVARKRYRILNKVCDNYLYKAALKGPLMAGYLIYISVCMCLCV